MKRAKKPKLPPSLRPWPCAILAIDPGERSGYAIFVRGVLVASGPVKMGGEAVVVAEAVVRAEGLPLVVVAEKWVAHGAFGGSRTMGGLGRHWGRWEGALLGDGITTRRIARVVPQTWQARVIPYRVGQDRDERLRLVEASAQRIKPGVTKDEAAAIGIGLWGIHAGAVGELIDLRHLDASGFDTSARRARSAVKAAAAKARREQRA